MKLLKTLVSIMAAMCLCLSVNAAFTKVLDYNDGRFTDVTADKWYAKEVASAYELGFMNGTSDTLFSPQGNVTVAQAVTIAVRVNAAADGKQEPAGQGEFWYSPYVDYAVENGIIEKGQFDSFTRNITRAEMACLFHDAMPDGSFAKINDVEYIPDVSKELSYAQKIYTLYNAGVVMGSDEYGTFLPDSSIVRSEAAAIINRVAIPQNRLKKTLKEDTARDAYLLLQNSKYTLENGWLLDNRGGMPKNALPAEEITPLTDVSETESTALIRKFNPIFGDVITADFDATFYKNGAYIQFNDKDGKPVYQLKLIDNAWQILKADGTYTSVKPVTLAENGTKFDFRIVVDLNKKTSLTYIDKVNCGTHPVLSDNISDFRFAVDKKSTGTIIPGPMRMTANYAFYEDFDYNAALDADYGWKNSGARLENNELVLENNASAYNTFNAVGGKVITEAYIYTKDTNTDTKLIVYANNTAALTVHAKDGKLYANDKVVYQKLVSNMWYRIRVESDTVGGNAKFYLNGRVVANVALSAKGDINKVALENVKGTAKYDRFKVYAAYDHPDYVPAPANKANLDDYIVGVNVCNLWYNGNGDMKWGDISAYDTHSPLIGYYDEGNPETADWEIKQMVEHGIDFQMFCWFSNNDENNAAIKESDWRNEHLLNGYMYAKYSDYMKYTIMWETYDASYTKMSSEQFREVVVPYWFENFFTDPRYLVVENKIVFPIYATYTLTTDKYFGSVEGAKAELDYLEQKAKEYGFDGFIFLGNVDTSETYIRMGLDGTFRYNRGVAGSQLNHNTEDIQKDAKVHGVHTVPTACVGFDNRPWASVDCTPLMSVSDYQKQNYWIRDSYLTNYDKNTWQGKMVVLSSWNEYGEGHYIAPSGLCGYGYLDVIRSTYTDLQKDHTDITPTAIQKERITHLYPQELTLLRRTQTYNKPDGEPVAVLDVNGFAVNNVVYPETRGSQILFPFDPGTGIEYAINSFSQWSRNDGTLKISANGHDVVFTVGKDSYTVDGAAKNLGYTLYTVDALPMLDFKLLSEALGYTYAVDGTKHSITTPEYELMVKVLKASEKDPGAFEFNSDVNNEWSSVSMSLVPKGNTLVAVSTDTNEDPQLYTVNKLQMPAAKYTGVEIRCKYSYKNQANQKNNMKFYFTTAVDTKLDEAKSFSMWYESMDSMDEWKTYYYDLTTLDTWNNYITMFRFDPFAGYGSFEIDYIRFVKDESYVEVPIEEREFEILGGDAENITQANCPFYVDSGVALEIIEDAGAENKQGNHVYKLTGGTSNPYTFIRQNVTFTQGKSYHIEFDTKVLGDIYGKTDTFGDVVVDLRYYDKSATRADKTDHIVGMVRAKVKDGWCHYEGDFDVTQVDSEVGHQFTIYLAPIDGAPGIYLLDNIKVIETDYVPKDIPSDNATAGEGFTLHDGDAENVTSKSTYFYTDGCEFESVEDLGPQNVEGNHVWKITGNAGAPYTYFRQGVKFTQGKTYRIEFDTKVLGDVGGNTDVYGDVVCNLRYKDNSNSRDDHVIGMVRAKVSDGWCHFEMEYTVTQVDLESGHQFTVYLAPINDTAGVFMLDNISVTELD